MLIPSALRANFKESTFCRLSFPSLRSLYAMVAVYSETSSEGLMSTTNLGQKRTTFRSLMILYHVLCNQCY